MRPTSLEVILHCDGVEVRRRLRCGADGTTLERRLYRPHGVARAVVCDLEDLAEALLADLETTTMTVLRT